MKKQNQQIMTHNRLTTTCIKGVVNLVLQNYLACPLKNAWGTSGLYVILCNGRHPRTHSAMTASRGTPLQDRCNPFPVHPLRSHGECTLNRNRDSALNRTPCFYLKHTLKLLGCSVERWVATSNAISRHPSLIRATVVLSFGCSTWLR